MYNKNNTKILPREGTCRTNHLPYRVWNMVSKNTADTSFRGFDAFSVAATDNRQFLEFTPSFYQITRALPGDELSVADTDSKILDLMKLTIQSDTEDMADDLGASKSPRRITN